jgi:hypothetical protein
MSCHDRYANHHDVMMQTCMKLFEYVFSTRKIEFVHRPDDANLVG